MSKDMILLGIRSRTRRKMWIPWIYSFSYIFRIFELKNDLGEFDWLTQLGYVKLDRSQKGRWMPNVDCSYNLNRNRSMSVTISTCNQICNAPTNQSSAKMLYSFPKQSRFLKRKPLLCDRFYDIKSTISTRGAGFGYGQKYDFTRESPASPPPNSYQPHSPDAKHGFAFGESRERMMITGPLVDTIQNKNPGPGNYELPNQRSKISYSLSGKIHFEDKEQLGVPGPGQYPVSFAISKNGKYFSAKHKNSCVRDFGRVLGRCQTAQNKLPGPGAYDVTTHQDISPKGRYCLSSSSNCLTRSFGTSQQRGDVTLNKTTPGPGNYRLPSEFGYYVAKKAIGKQNEGSERPSAS